MMPDPACERSAQDTTSDLPIRAFNKKPGTIFPFVTFITVKAVGNHQLLLANLGYMKRQNIFIALGVLAIIAVVAILFLGNKSDVEQKLTVNESAGQLIDSNNEPVDFSAFQGKVVFVNNWASWCPPCIVEMPSIEELKGKLKGEDVVFVMVSFDQEKEKATEFIKRKGFDFDVYFPGPNYPFMTPSIPATFILDKEGKTVSQQVGMADYSEDEIFEELKALAAQ